MTPLARTPNLAERLCMPSRWPNAYGRTRGVRLSGHCRPRAVESPRDRHGAVLRCVGRGSYLNRNTMLHAVASLTVGRHGAIGPGCYPADPDRGTDPAHRLAQDRGTRPTAVGDWAWLGANVVVLKGVTIGARTVVGAGSVVTRRLPPDVITAGVPGRVIRSRPTEA